MNKARIPQMAIKNARRKRRKSFGLEFSGSLFESQKNIEERTNMLETIMKKDI